LILVIHQTYETPLAVQPERAELREGRQGGIMGQQLGIVGRIIIYGFRSDCDRGRGSFGDGMGFVADLEQAAIGDTRLGAL
jgi:hypothetical protein